MKIARILVLLCALVTGSLVSRASHVLGGNITWECSGGNSYTITLRMYTDCFGASNPLPTENVYCEPAGCGALPFNADLNFVSATEISDLCAAELANSSCSGGVIPGTKLLVYTGTVTLDTSCSWDFFWIDGDWNYFNNINYAATPGAYIFSELGTGAGCTNSIDITSMQAPYECRNNGNITNNITVSGAAGYTLSYALATPQTIADEADPLGPTITVPGYTNLNGVTVNPTTGAVTFNSNGIFAGNYIVTIAITITQGATTIGVIYENMPIIIRDCSATTTDFTAPPVQNLSANAILATATSIDVCAGDSICFDVVASNSNLQRAITITETHPAILNAGNPTLTLDPLSLNPRTATFCMATTGAMVGGPYIIHFEATDDACVLPGFDTQDITINIYPSVTLSVTDTMICAGTTLPVTASGGQAGATYTWTVLSGDNTPGLSGTSGTQNLTTLDSDSEIQVQLNGVPASCNARDTLNVQVSLADLTFSVTNESCLQNDGAIDLTVAGGSGNYTYAWATGQAIEDITGLDGVQYCVTVTDTSVPGCTKNECITVGTQAPPGGTITAQGGVTTICQGQTATLVFDGTGQAGEPYALTVTGTGATSPASILDNGTFTVSPPVGTTTYTLTNVSYVNFPGCSVPTNSAVTITVRPTVTGSFLAAGPVCSGSTLNLPVDLSAAGNYNVTYTASPADPASAPNPAANPWTDNQILTFNPTQTTTYTITNVEYTTAPLCPSNTSNSTVVTVNPLPAGTLSGGTTICAGASANLGINMTAGTAPFTVNYTANGNAATLTNVTANYTWTVTPATTTTYVITSITDANGCTSTISSQNQQVVVNPFPDFTFTGNASICTGSSTNLVLTEISTGGPYDIILGIGDADPLTPATVTLDNFNGGNYSVSPTSNTTYTLQSIIYDGVPACAVTPNTTVTINVSQAPIILNITQTCNNISTGYTVSFTISGTAPYTVNTVASGANYTSGNIVSGSGATFTIDDNGACPALVYNQPIYICPIITNAGTMSATPITICGTTAATGVQATAPATDGNDQIQYVLHTSSTNALGTVIATDCNDLSFGDADTPLTFSNTPVAGQIQYGVTYYISTVVGDDSGNGDCVNTAAANVSIAPGQPVTWYESPTASIGGTYSTCAGTAINIPINFTGQAPWTFVYAIGGTAQPAITTSNNPYQLSTSTAGTYTLNSVASVNCAGTVSGSASLTVNPLPGATLSASTSTCASTCVNLTMTLTGTGPWTVNYTIGGVAQTPLNVATSPFTWNLCPTQTSTYCLTQITDANNCVGTSTSCSTITVNPLPTAVFAGSASFCAGSSVALPITFTGTAPFNYVITTPSGNVNGGPNAGTNGSYTANAAGAYFITSVTDANCPNTADSPTVNVTSNALPTAAITNNGVICSGANFTFNYTLTGAAPFTFNLDAPVTDLNNVPSAGTTGSIVDNDAGNYIITSVTDNNGCTSAAASATATLTVNPLPVTTFGVSGTICQGATYNFTTNLTTGTGPFNYTVTTPSGDVLVNNANTGNQFPATAAGNYFITSVTDANSCTNTTDSPTVTLTVNPLPVGTFAGPVEYCAGGSTNLVANFTGTGPWSYTVTNPTGASANAPATVTNSANYSVNIPGSYFITSVTDANCTNTTDSPSVVVTQNALPTANISNNGVICSGQTFTFNYTLTGEAPFSYNLDAPVTDSNNNASPNLNGSFTASDAGSYTITQVTDNNGCVSSGSSNTANLVVNPLPVATISGNAAICADANHDFTVTLTTGTAPFSYTITTPGGDVTESNVTNPDLYTTNVNGSYFVTSVTDNNGCTNAANSTTSVLTVHPLPTATWNSGNVAFCAGSNINIIFACTGTAPWTVSYTIDGVAQTNLVVNASPYILTVSTPGNYCLTNITDANTCQSALNACITVTQVAVPTANAGPNLSTCSGVPITIGTPSVAGVNYTWTNGFGAAYDNGAIAQPTITVANGGGVAITNFNALLASITASGITCSDRDTMDLTVFPLPTITAVAADDSICFNTSTTLTASGAGAGGNYVWTADPSITSASNIATITVAPAGLVTYTVTGTNANSCVNTATVNVLAGTDITVNEQFSAQQCFGVCDGFITLTPSGSFPPYAVAWGQAMPAAGLIQTDLCAGTFDYDITDSEGCNTVADNLSVQIIGLPENFIDDVVLTEPICSGDATGTIQIIEANAIDYTLYSEPGLEFIGPQAGNTFNNLLPGNYDVYATDVNGCPVDSLNITLSSQSAPIDITVDQFNQIFCFGQTLDFTGSASGGFGNLVLNWYNCPDTLGCLIGQGTPFGITITQDTTLYGVVTDELGCRSEIASVLAELSDPILLDIVNGPTAEICEGECIDLVASTQGGNVGLTIQWFELPSLITDPTIGPDGTVQNVCPQLSTSYYAYASDGCNTPAYDTIAVTVFETPEVIFSVDVSEGCSPLEVTFTNLTDPALIDNCLWDFGNGQLANVCGTITYSYDDLGSFEPSLTVTSPDNCVATDTIDFPVIVYGYPEIEFTWDPETIDVLNPEVEFTNLTQGGVTYDWSFATFGSSTDVNPVFTFPAVDLATYTVCLESETDYGCRDTLCHDLTVSSILQVWVPTAFTPDGDNLNEVFLPVLKGYNPDSYRFWVYDRWGTIVFHTTDPKQAWQGNVGDGIYYPQTDTFVWRIEVQRLSDNTYQVLEGHVTMVR